MTTFQIEYRAKSEALRLREMEQRELERKYGKKKAKEVAQQNFEVHTRYVKQAPFDVLFRVLFWRGFLSHYSPKVLEPVPRWHPLSK
jgi:hypothetical protein